MPFLRRLQEQANNTTATNQQDDGDDNDRLAIIAIIVAALVIIVALLFCCYYAYLLNSRKSAVVKEEVEKPYLEDQPTDKEEESEVETKVEEAPDTLDTRQIVTTCDVHACTSMSCELCRKSLKPKFINVQTENVSNGLRISGLPHRWWDRNFDEKKMKERFNKACEEKERVYTDEQPTAMYQL